VCTVQGSELHLISACKSAVFSQAVYPDGRRLVKAVRESCIPITEPSIALPEEPDRTYNYRRYRRVCFATRFRTAYLLA
jgi:hypothetical protein